MSREPGSARPPISHSHASRPTPGEVIDARASHLRASSTERSARGAWLDGNGRIGRLLITFLLCERDVLHKPVLYLSRYFKRHRTEYYERLQSIRDAGDFERWLAFFLRGIAKVSVEAADTARRILELKERHRRAITDNLGRAAGNGHRVLEQLFERPIMSVGDVRALLGTTFAGANQVVQRLEDSAILLEFTGQARHRRFRYDPNIRLFDEEAAAATDLGAPTEADTAPMHA